MIRPPKSRTRAAAIALLAALCATGARADVTRTMKVSSHAMEPTLHFGDDVEVGVFTYLMSSPARGEVVVFQVQLPGERYFSMQRVIGLPGDHVIYSADKRLRINGTPVATTLAKDAPPPGSPGTQVYREALPGADHRILIHPDRPATEPPPGLAKEPTCRVNEDGFDCVVPPDHYLLMGDNRDNTRDSRFLGFISAGVIAGRVHAP